MITIEIEFTTKTVMGLSEAKASKNVFDNLMHDDVIAWVRKAIANENVRRPMITFGYYDEKTSTEVSTARIIGEWDDTYSIVTWDDRGNVTKHVKNVKVDTRFIRKVYAHNVDRQLVYKTKFEEELGA